MPSVVFRLDNLGGNYAVTRDSSKTFSLPLYSGSLPASNYVIKAVTARFTDTFQYSSSRKFVLKNADSDTAISDSIAPSGNSSSSNTSEELIIACKTTPLSLYEGFNPFRLKITSDGSGSSGNILSVRAACVITLTIDWEYSFTSCGAPTSATLAASVSEGEVTLNYSGASAGVQNAITGYEIQYADSTDNSTWGAWTALKTVSNAGTSGSTTLAVPGTRGHYRKYQMRTQGAAGSGYYSPWKAVSGSVRRNSAPAAPGVTAPVASKIIYNAQPRILATVGSDTDGHSQTLAASGYAASSTGAQAAGKKLVLRRSSALAAGAQSVSVSSTDTLGVASSAVTRSFTYAVPSWTDASLVAGTTPIKAAHMTELQEAINNVRAYYGMAAYSFTAITVGSTGLSGWTSHVTQLRAAIEEVVSLVNGWDTANSTNDISLPAWISISVNCPAAAVIAQLRAAIPLL